MSSSGAVFRSVGSRSKLAKAARWTWSRYVVQRMEMRAQRPDVACEPLANTGADATFTRHYVYVDSEGEFQPCKREAVVAALWRALIGQCAINHGVQNDLHLTRAFFNQLFREMAYERGLRNLLSTYRLMH